MLSLLVVLAGCNDDVDLSSEVAAATWADNLKDSFGLSPPDWTMIRATNTEGVSMHGDASFYFEFAVPKARFESVSAFIDQCANAGGDKWTVTRLGKNDKLIDATRCPSWWPFPRSGQCDRVTLHQFTDSSHKAGCGGYDFFLDEANGKLIVNRWLP
ncbi:MAG: hypothetical protein QM754_11055 [Tepidisphaeraceae bacterium]